MALAKAKPKRPKSMVLLTSFAASAKGDRKDPAGGSERHETEAAVDDRASIVKQDKNTERNDGTA